MKTDKIINWSDEKIDHNEYARRVDEAIKAEIDDDLKRICERLSSN
ncbi:MAG: hypothetical protein LBF00_01345 [Mycoplasmataceae bacterium]|jgi:chromosome condensin MukBEF complex kleisin-like MukF subunit|nr:hypothetical protein [Mycoplasmataceae bacterium]